MSIDLSKPYNRKDAIDFLSQDLLPNDFLPIEEEIDIPFSSSRMIKKATLLGTCDSLDLRIYEFEHESEHDPRVTITKEAFRFLATQGQQKSLAFFKSKSDNYRFSLITMDLKTDGKKIEKIMSNPRRFSYYLGTNAKINTPTKYLIINGRVSDFKNLKDRFSVEVVNKEFFDIIAEQFMQLVGGQRGTKDYQNGCLSLPGGNDHQLKQEFGVRLLGRIIFCWFLKKKTSIQGKPLITNGILDSKSVLRNYYHAILEVLFFEILNRPIEERKKIFRNEIYDYIPFLNGGLFQPHDDDYYIFDQRCNIDEYANIGFSKYNSQLHIKDNWFRELFDHLETYNFTIDENTSSDIDLSVDPEMLGRIFENLLAEINPDTRETARKATGSYYTPRDIVDYMVNQSLKYYLLHKTSLAEDLVNELLESNEIQREIEESDKIIVIKALSEIKVLDPACGSGAFPMGILQKIVSILHDIDPDSKLWLELILSKIEDNTTKKVIKSRLDQESISYIFKLGIIQNSIFGIDIQQIAVEISKLRFFLSLIVETIVDDTKENRSLEPLPNLEFKFVCANSLVDLPEGKTYLGGSDQLTHKLRMLRSQYFKSIGDEKKRIENDFKRIQNELLQIYSIWNSKDQKSQFLSLWNPFSSEQSNWFNSEWMFGVHDGFDIVIANPPYGADIDNFTDLYGNLYPKTSKGFKDIYKYFFNCSLDNFLNKVGVLCFITPNTFFLQPRYSDLRRLLLEYNIKMLISLGEDIFEAVVPTAISLVQGGRANNYNMIHFVDITNASVCPDSIDKLPFKKINQEIFLHTPNNIFADNIRKKLDDEDYLDNILDMRDGGLKYQRVNVGLSQKGNNDLAERLFYFGKKKNKTDILILIGKDIHRNGYALAPQKEKYLISNFKSVLKDNEIVYFNRELLDAPIKIIWRQTAPYFIGCVLKDETWFGNTIQGGIIKEKYKNILSPYYLIGLLSSKYLRYLYTNSVKETGRVFPQVKLEKLKPLPIKIIPKSKQVPIIELCLKIELLLKNEQESEIFSLINQIDKLVYKLYDLTPEEIDLVENSI